MSGKLSSKVKKSFPTIEAVSIGLLIESYNLAMIDKRYDLDWEEDQFTNYLINFMRKSPLSKKHLLDIVSQYQLIKDGLPINNNNPKTLPIIDIRIFTWQLPNQKEYFFEAKNLCQNNWKKKSGAKVSAYDYTKRYVDTGIENFRIARYYNGALVGYVLEGNTSSIIEELNKRLNKDTNTIKNIKPKLVSALRSSAFKDIYSSIHITPSRNNLEIKHIFLKF